MRWCVVVLLASGCNLLDGARQTAACDLRSAGEIECQEYGVFGPDRLTLQGTCEAVSGDWISGPCPREGILAGCEDQDPSNPWNVTRWIYAGLDEEVTTEDEAWEECDEEVEVPVPAPSE